MTAPAAAPAPFSPRMLLRHSAIYAVARVGLSALDLLFLPLYTRVLSPEDTGLVAVGTVLTTLVTLALPFGFSNALGRFFFDGERGSPAHRTTVGALLCGVVLAGAGLTLLLSVGGAGAWGPLLRGVPARFFLLTVWACLATILFPVAIQLLQLQQAPQRFLWASLFAVTVRGVAIVVGVVVLRRGAMGWAEANLAAAVLTGAFAWWSVRGAGPFRVEGAVLRPALAYGLPLLLHQLAGWASVFANRLIINQFASLREVAVFQVGFGVGQVMSLVTTSFNAAYGPMFMGVAARSRAEAGERFGRLVPYYLAALMGLYLALSLGAEPLVRLAAPASYGAAAALVPIVLGMFVLQGIYFILVNPVFFDKQQTRRLPWVTLGGAAVGVTLCYLLTPRYGSMGAAAAGVVNNLLVLAGVYPLSRRAVPLVVNGRLVAGVLASGLGLVLAGRALAAWSHGIGRGVLLLVVALGVYLGLLALLGFRLPAGLWPRREPTLPGSA